MFHSTRLLRWGLILSALLCVTYPAKAGLLPVSVSVLPEGDGYRFTYGVVLTSDSVLQHGDFFTIYDFAGFIPGSNYQPEEFAFEFSSSFVGPTPLGTLPVDDPNLPNLTWRYVGETTTVGQIGLGNFWAVSEFGESTLGWFTALTHREADGVPEGNITQTEIPVPTSPPPPVPEPGTLTMLVLGLPFAGCMFSRMRRPVTS